MRCVFVVKQLLVLELYLLDVEVKENTEKAAFAEAYGFRGRARLQSCRNQLVAIILAPWRHE